MPSNPVLKCIRGETKREKIKLNYIKNPNYFNRNYFINLINNEFICPIGILSFKFVHTLPIKKLKINYLNIIEFIDSNFDGLNCYYDEIIICERKSSCLLDGYELIKKDIV